MVDFVFCLFVFVFVKIGSEEIVTSLRWDERSK